MGIIFNENSQTNNISQLRIEVNDLIPWRRGLVVSSPPATEETKAMGRETESRQGIHRVVAYFKKLMI
jgi:hypothetical protein